MWDGGYADIVIRLFLFRPDPRRVQSRFEPHSFVFHVCLWPDAAMRRHAALRSPTDPEAKYRPFSRARVGAVFRDPLRPTLSPAAQRKRNDEWWESMSVAAASPLNQHLAVGDNVSRGAGQFAGL